MTLKAKVEALLFVSDKPLKAQVMSRILGEEVQSVRQAVLELVHDYEERGGGLEVADDDGYALQVKEQFANLMEEFMPIELSVAVIRTLSAIAIKQPIAQSEIIRIRGASAYDHVKELVERDLVAKRDDGRSPILSTTKRFQEYFRLTKDGKSLRQYLKRQVKKLEKSEEDAVRQLELPPLSEDLPELEAQMIREAALLDLDPGSILENLTAVASVDGRDISSEDFAETANGSSFSPAELPTTNN